MLYQSQLGHGRKKGKTIILRGIFRKTFHFAHLYNTFSNKKY